MLRKIIRSDLFVANGFCIFVQLIIERILSDCGEHPNKMFLTVVNFLVFSM